MAGGLADLFTFCHSVVFNSGKRKQCVTRRHGIRVPACRPEIYVFPQNEPHSQSGVTTTDWLHHGDTVMENRSAVRLTASESLKNAHICRGKITTSRQREYPESGMDFYEPFFCHNGWNNCESWVPKEKLCSCYRSLNGLVVNMEPGCLLYSMV